MVDKNQTKFTVICNSGAKLVRLIKCYRSKNPKIGSIILVSILSKSSNSKVSKGTKVKALVVHLKQPFKRTDNSITSVNSNSVVLLQGNTKNPLGSRVLGPVPVEIKDMGFEKIVSLAIKTF